MTPTIINLQMPIANQEYAVLLPSCDLCIIQARVPATIQLAYKQGQSNTNFLTLPAGTSKSIQFGVSGFNAPMYFMSSVINQVLEIELWN